MLDEKKVMINSLYALTFFSFLTGFLSGIFLLLMISAVVIKSLTGGIIAIILLTLIVCLATIGDKIFKQPL